MKKETKEKIEEYGPNILAYVDSMASAIVVSSVIEAVAKTYTKPTKLSKVLILIAGSAIACTVSQKVYEARESSWRNIFEDIKPCIKDICKALKKNTEPEIEEITE